MLGKRIRRVGPSTTLSISEAARTLRAGGADVIDLSIGEPDFPTPGHIKDAAKRALDADFTHYTANGGMLELREAICDKLACENDLHYEPNEILASSGAKFSCYVALRAMLEEGQDVIIPAPYWVSYPEQVHLAGGNPIFVSTEDSGFCLTPEQLRASLTPKTAMLVLNYPNNPSGATYDAEQLAALAAVCAERDVWILSDEIYEKLIYDGTVHRSIAAVSEEARARTIVVNGLSKAYAMTGWRIGYAAGPRQIIVEMAKVQSHATSAPNSIAQAASIVALQGPQDEVTRMRDTFAERRDVLLAALRAIDGVRCRRPQGAFYLFADITSLLHRRAGERSVETSHDLAHYLLEEAHVATVPGDAFGSPRYLRLSYAAAIDRIEEAGRRLATALAALKP